jgi:hypothetical protein
MCNLLHIVCCDFGIVLGSLQSCPEQSSRKSCSTNGVGVLQLTMYAIDLRRHDEVALRETVNFVGPEGYFHFPPRQQDIRVMTLLLSESPDPVHEVECLLEIGKGE